VQLGVGLDPCRELLAAVHLGDDDGLEVLCKAQDAIGRKRVDDGRDERCHGVALARQSFDRLLDSARRRSPGDDADLGLTLGDTEGHAAERRFETAKSFGGILELAPSFVKLGGVHLRSGSSARHARRAPGRSK